ncbi:MAG: hypothetical protein ACK5HT_13205 [Draconibacterium sp.]
MLPTQPKETLSFMLSCQLSNYLEDEETFLKSAQTSNNLVNTVNELLSIRDSIGRIAYYRKVSVDEQQVFVYKKFQMKLLPIIISILFFILVFTNNKINNSKGGFILIITATLILLIDGFVNKERFYISLVFVIIGIVKLIERICNFKGNKNMFH